MASKRKIRGIDDRSLDMQVFFMSARELVAYLEQMAETEPENIAYAAGFYMGIYPQFAPEIREFLREECKWCMTGF